MNFKEISINEALSVYPLMAQLRPHLSEAQFVDLFKNAQQSGGYKLLGLFKKDRCVGLMGYRILFDFVHGKHLYIDDLVVDETLRSTGIGGKLLAHSKEIAKQNQCHRLRLCTGNDNHKGMKFYEKNGWEQRAVVYKTKLAEAP